MDRALVNATNLDGLQDNMRQIIVDQIAEVAHGKAKLYPSLISRLCYEARVSFKPKNEEKKPAKNIYPHKEERWPREQKKRQIDTLVLSFRQLTEPGLDTRGYSK